MTISPPTPVIAIDGGGTNCRFLLSRPEGNVQVISGSANVWSSPEAALRTLHGGLVTLVSKAGLPQSALMDIPVYAGLAGVISPDVAARIENALPARFVRVEEDQRCAVVGALGEHDGTIASIGTGSFFGRQMSGQITLIGGHGAVLGDEASAAWLGRRLLQKCLHVLDGISTASPLSKACTAQLGGKAADIVDFARSATPASLGELAPQVSKSAAHADVLAIEIMQEGASYIQAALAALGYVSGERLCFMGSVAPQYQTFLPACLTDAIAPAQGNALQGALTLAQRFATEVSAVN